VSGEKVQLVNPEVRMLEIAKAIVLREQDVAGREHDIARRRQELETKERELAEKKRDLVQLRLDFSAVATGKEESPRPAPDGPPPVRDGRHPSLARAAATVAHRVLSLLEMEPRPLTAGEIYNQLELPPPIDTLRTTLWKMEKHGLIARPFPGQYCALQYAGTFSASGEGVG
jgi:hypothetical protein